MAQKYKMNRITFSTAIDQLAYYLHLTALRFYMCHGFKSDLNKYT